MEPKVMEQATLTAAVRCDHCFYARKHKSQVGALECMFNLPMLVPVQAGGGMGAVSIRPCVAADDFCQHFTPGEVKHVAGAVHG